MKINSLCLMIFNITDFDNLKKPQIFPLWKLLNSIIYSFYTLIFQQFSDMRYRFVTPYTWIFQYFLVFLTCFPNLELQLSQHFPTIHINLKSCHFLGWIKWPIFFF